MLKNLLLTVSTVAICAVGFSAKSATASISYTNTIASELTDWTNGVGLQQFNSSLGTLESIQLTMTVNVSTVLSLTNTAATPSTGFGTTMFQLYYNNAYGLLGSSGGSSPAFNLLTPMYSYSLAGYSSVVSGNIQTNASLAGPLVTDGSALSAFTGAGSVTLPASTFTVAGVYYSGGNITDSQKTSASLTSVITYDFVPSLEPVPEPSVFAMMGAGLAGLGVIWRRRSAK